jgi:hypothetical protein
MIILPIKYPTDFPFLSVEVWYLKCTLLEFNTARLTPYLIFYIQKYFGLLYKDIRGGYIPRNVVRR